MNWRRGFIRLWLVASVTWIAVNGFVFRLPEAVVETTPWLRPVRPSDLALSDQKPTEIRVRSADGVIHAFPAGTDQAVINRTINAYAQEHQLATTGYATLLPNDVKLDAPGEQRPWTKDQKTDDLPADVPSARVYQAQRYQAAIANLRGFATFGIGAPVVLLLLGIAGWWIGIGFKTPSA